MAELDEIVIYEQEKEKFSIIITIIKSIIIIIIIINTLCQFPLVLFPNLKVTPVAQRSVQTIVESGPANCLVEK